MLLLARNLSTLALFVPSLARRYNAWPGPSIHALLSATARQALALQCFADDEHEHLANAFSLHTLAPHCFIYEPGCPGLQGNRNFTEQNTPRYRFPGGRAYDYHTTAIQGFSRHSLLEQALRSEVTLDYSNVRPVSPLPQLLAPSTTSTYSGHFHRMPLLASDVPETILGAI